MDIEIKNGLDYPQEIRELFREYTDMLCENDPSFKKYLDLQKYDDELRDLSRKYGYPKGRLFIVKSGDRSIGCIGLKDCTGNACEIKRLYVRPEARGMGLGEKLVNLILDEGAKIGYEYVKLDTLPFLKTALKLYKKLGFYETEKYNDSPMDTSIYLCYDLKNRK